MFKMLHSLDFLVGPSQDLPPRSEHSCSVRILLWACSNCCSDVNISGHADHAPHSFQTQSKGQHPSLQLSVRLASLGSQSFPEFLLLYLIFLVSAFMPTSQVTEHAPQLSIQSLYVQSHA